jgi:hypothetical protein
LREEEAGRSMSIVSFFIAAPQSPTQKFATRDSNLWLIAVNQESSPATCDQQAIYFGNENLLLRQVDVNALPAETFPMLQLRMQTIAGR